MPQPRIEIHPLVLRLGQVYAGDKAKGEVTIRNVGDAPLVIRKIDKSCGCTAALLREEDKVVDPGKEVKAQVTLQPSGTRHGELFRKVIVIVSNRSRPRSRRRSRAVSPTAPQTEPSSRRT